MEDSFGQLAGVSAFLGGFVITFLGALATSQDKRRFVGFTLGVSASAAACLVLAALGWALLAAQAASVSNAKGATRAALLAQLRDGLGLSGFVSMLFVLGVALLIVLLGASGWLRSRRVGYYTSVLAVFMALAAGVIVTPFVQRTGSEGSNNPSKPAAIRNSA